MVRRYQLEAGGHWFLCDCRSGLERPPALVPVLETFIRRHVQAGWPPHAEACEFFREAAEQADITASYRPLPRPRVRLVRAFDRASADPTRPPLRVSSASRRPQLAKLLSDLMLHAGLQVVPAADERPSAPDQLRHCAASGRSRRA